MMLVKTFIKCLPDRYSAFNLNDVWTRLPELELIIKKKRTGIDKFWIETEVSYKLYNAQINFPFNFLIQKYFFHDNRII